MKKILIYCRRADGFRVAKFKRATLDVKMHTIYRKHECANASTLQMKLEALYWILYLLIYSILTECWFTVIRPSAEVSVKNFEGSHTQKQHFFLYTSLITSTLCCVTFFLSDNMSNSADLGDA